MWVALIDQLLDLMGPVHLGAPLSHIYPAPALKWFAEHKHVHYSTPLVFVVSPLGLSWHYYRRLSKDYERKVQSSESFMEVAMRSA